MYMKKLSTRNKVFLISIVSVIIFLLFVFFAIFLLFPSKYNKQIYSASQKYDLEPELVYAIIWTESRFDVSAKSEKGAIGLMQLMPSTASWLYGDEINENILKNIDINIDLGCKYLKYLFDKFHEPSLVLAAYNAGEGNVANWIESGTTIPYIETRKYIKKVNAVKKLYDIKSIIKGLIKP